MFADFNLIVRRCASSPAPPAAPRLPHQAAAVLPVRAAARTADGVWRIGGAWITATGGGCTLPSIGSGSPEWQERLNG